MAASVAIWEANRDGGEGTVWRDAAAHVLNLPPARRLLVFYGNEGELMFEYYARRSGRMLGDRTGLPRAFRDMEPPRAMQRVQSVADMAAFWRVLADRQPDEILLVAAHSREAEAEVVSYLGGRARLLDQSGIGSVHLYRFAYPP